jgi:hypothetical protein
VLQKIRSAQQVSETTDTGPEAANRRSAADREEEKLNSSISTASNQTSNGAAESDGEGNEWVLMNELIPEPVDGIIGRSMLTVYTVGYTCVSICAVDRMQLDTVRELGIVKLCCGCNHTAHLRMRVMLSCSKNSASLVEVFRY